MRLVANNTAFDVDGVVFDKDGTLIDLDAAWAPRAMSWIEVVSQSVDEAVARDVAAAIELDVDRRSVVPGGILAAATMEVLVDTAHGVLRERGWTREQTQVLIDGGSGSIEPIGDVASACRAFAGAGLRLGILTSDDRRDTRAHLDVLGIGDLVDAIVCGDDGLPAKPDPEGLHHVADEMGLIAGRVLMIGDSPSDIDVARRASAAGAIALDGPHTAARTVEIADAAIRTIGELRIDGSERHE